MSFESTISTLWSLPLANDLLAGMTPELLDEIDPNADRNLVGLVDAWRCELAERSLTDTSLQSTIVGAWRASHEDIVAAARLLSPEVNQTHLQSMLQHFGAKDLLLEQLTDEPDSGEAAVRWFVDNVADPQTQNELQVILGSWFEHEETDAPFEVADGLVARIVIFGGHVRDEKKMESRLFRDSPFEVVWKPFEKGGASQTTRSVNEAMARMDAVLLVTSMVSHTLMGMVKRHARINGIRFRTIPKATDVHLTQVLSELFPDLLRHTSV